MTPELFNALHDLTAPSDSLYPSLTGLLFTEGYLVASDGGAMVVLATSYKPHAEGRIFERNKQEIKAKPLNYKGAIADIPEYPGVSDHYLHIDDIAGLKNACELIPTSPEDQMICIEIAQTFFYPARVLKVLKVFELLNESYEAYVEQKESNFRRLVFRSGSCLGVIMNAVFKSENTTSYKYTIEEALIYGDLL